MSALILHDLTSPFMRFIHLSWYSEKGMKRHIQNLSKGKNTIRDGGSTATYAAYNALCSKGWHLKKSFHEMFNFENWFFCQFSSNTRFSFGGGSLNTPKIGKRKKEFIYYLYINLRGSKTKKTWRGGGCHGQNGSQNFRFHKCYDICFYNFCEKHPLIRKNRF